MVLLLLFTVRLCFAFGHDCHMLLLSEGLAERTWSFCSTIRLLLILQMFFCLFVCCCLVLFLFLVFSNFSTRGTELSVSQIANFGLSSVFFNVLFWLWLSCYCLITSCLIFVLQTRKGKPRRAFRVPLEIVKALKYNEAGFGVRKQNITRRLQLLLGLERSLNGKNGYLFFFFNMYSYLRRFVPYSWIVFTFLLQLSSCTRVFTRTKVFVSKRKSTTMIFFSAAFDSSTPSTRVALIEAT